jgi:hypothetical protein
MYRNPYTGTVSEKMWVLCANRRWHYVGRNANVKQYCVESYEVQYGSYYNKVKNGKAVPLQAWTGLEGG